MNFDLARRPILVNMLCVVLFVITAMSIGVGHSLGGDLIFAHALFGTPVEQLLMVGADMSPLAAKILTAGVLLINSFYITRLTIRSVVYLSHSFLPAMFLMCLGFSSFGSVYSFVALLSILMVLLSIDGMVGSYSVKGLASGRWFVVGVYAGLAGVIYMPCTLFAVMIPLGLMFFRAFDIREWTAAVAGYALMLFYCAFADYFAMGGGFFDTFKDIIAFWRDMSPLKGVLAFTDSYFLPDWVLLGASTVAALLSVVSFVAKGSVYKPLELRTFEFLILMLIITAVVVLLSGVSMISFLPLLSMALAFVLPAYFVNHGGTFISNFLFVVILGSAIVTMLITR